MVTVRVVAVIRFPIASYKILPNELPDRFARVCHQRRRYHCARAES